MKPIEEITKRLELVKEQLVYIEANHKVYNDEDHWYNQIESAEYDTLIRTLEWVLRP
jgi:hypothetical protein